MYKYRLYYAHTVPYRTFYQCPKLKIAETIMYGKSIGGNFRAFLVMSQLLRLCLCWDADAGIIQSLTKGNHVTATATSSVQPAKRVLDNNDNTNWISDYCLPTRYINRPHVNVLLGACKNGSCKASSSVQNDIDQATDGSVYTVAHIYTTGGTSNATFQLAVNPNMYLKVITISAIFQDNNTVLYAYENKDGSTIRHNLRTFSTSENYQAIQIFNDANFTTSKLEIESTSGFSLKEFAAMGPDGCIEKIIIDLGSQQRVGTIRTRHWTGAMVASSLFMKTSVDGQTWTVVKSLNPEAVHAVTTSIPPQVVQYIALEYHVILKPYNKVYCFEIDAWDENGIWGPEVLAKPQTSTLREILGVNGIWGWGHNKYSDALPPGQGPQLYNIVASHARNYHNLNWDVTDPDLDPQFTEMAAGNGTQATWWLNWDKEYRMWKSANLYVDVSIQFTNKTTPQYLWNSPEQSAFHYGQEFAKHFGSVRGNGLVDALEIGNEPWDYDASFYAAVLKGMSAGVRSMDTAMTIIPATFQAEDKHQTSTYIGTRVLPEVADHIDVINCHTYSFVNSQDGVRTGTYPEHKESSFNNIRPITRWRDANTPKKPIWVTEWGWDSSGEGESCTFSECVTEQAQAVYAIRGLLILARSNIERATWFFYANTDCNTLFCRSGLTTSKRHNFAKKTTFLAFENLLSHIGDAYFMGVFQESDKGFVYIFGKTFKPTFQALNSTSVFVNASHIVAWLPVDITSRQLANVHIELPVGMHPTRGWRFTCVSKEHPVQELTNFAMTGQTITVELTTEPVVIELASDLGAVIIG